MKVVAFTGMPFSGKTEAVQVAKDMGIPVVRMGDLVWDEVKNRGLELNDRNVGKIADQMRKQHGKDIWARKTMDKIKAMGEVDSLVIDGIRNLEEIEAFKQGLEKKFIVVAVQTSKETRQKRALKRGREDDIQDIKEIDERDRREMSWGLGVVITSADIVVSNEGSIDEFSQKIKKILDEI